MVVYVLCEGYDYEGEEVRGVYASLEEAQAAAAAYRRDRYIGDYLMVYASEVGAAAVDVDSVWYQRHDEVVE